jgi:hypothetical protein
MPKRAGRRSLCSSACSNIVVVMKGISADGVGLCAECRFARIVRSDRGSTFYLCERSLTDPLFPKYPRLPVLTCSGYCARREEAGTRPPVRE